MCNALWHFYIFQYFKLKVKNPEKPIACGLEVPAVIEYIAHDAVEHSDRVVVTVDGTVLEVPLKGWVQISLIRQFIYFISLTNL